jgi:hypothetical protein
LSDLFIDGIYNYCDRWCERCAFTARCRLFADEQKFLAEAQRPSDDQNADFWDVFDEVTEDALELEEADFFPEPDLLLPEREDPFHELAERDPLVRLSHDYAMHVHAWLEQHESDFPAEENRFRARRDAISPTEARR